MKGGKKSAHFSPWRAISILCHLIQLYHFIAPIKSEFFGTYDETFDERLLFLATAYCLWPRCAQVMPDRRNLLNNTWAQIWPISLFLCFFTDFSHSLFHVCYDLETETIILRDLVYDRH